MGARPLSRRAFSTLLSIFPSPKTSKIDENRLKTRGFQPFVWPEAWQAPRTRLGAYDGCRDFERPKYGVLNVHNDYRGVVRAKQYGRVAIYTSLANILLYIDYNTSEYIYDIIYDIYDLFL